MNNVLRVAGVGLAAGGFFYVLAGFAPQAAQVSAEWSVSQEPTMQWEMGEEGQRLVDPLGFVWVKAQTIMILRGGTRSAGEDAQQPLASKLASVSIRDGVPAELWSVRHQDGSEATKVLLPPGLKLLAVGEDYVICGWSDSEGVQHMGRYALDRG